MKKLKPVNIMIDTSKNRVKEIVFKLLSRFDLLVSDIAVDLVLL